MYVHVLVCICPFSRILEAVLIVMVTTVCIFLIATLLGTCVKERADDNEEYLCPGLTVWTEVLRNLEQRVDVHAS